MEQETKPVSFEDITGAVGDIMDEVDKLTKAYRTMIHEGMDVDDEFAIQYVEIGRFLTSVLSNTALASAAYGVSADVR